MLKRLLSFLLRAKEPVLPAEYWTEEFLPNSGCLEGDEARVITKYRYGEIVKILPYHPVLVEALLNNNETVVDLTNQANTGPECIPKVNVSMDMVSMGLKKELRVWNIGKQKRGFGL